MTMAWHLAAAALASGLLLSAGASAAVKQPGPIGCRPPVCSEPTFPKPPGPGFPKPGPRGPVYVLPR